MVSSFESHGKAHAVAYYLYLLPSYQFLKQHTTLITTYQPLQNKWWSAKNVYTLERRWEMREKIKACLIAWKNHVSFPSLFYLSQVMDLCFSSIPGSVLPS